MSEKSAGLDFSAIDQQIADAQQTKARNAGQPTEASEQSERKRGRKRLSDEEKAARDQARAEEREQKRQEREALKAKRQAEREANKEPAHLSKVRKALDKLPELSQAAQNIFSDIIGSDTSLSEIEALASHLEGHVRLQRTKQALETELEVGQTVRIVGGDVRFVGQLGTVSKAQRIRCYVDVPGVDKSVYLFTSDVEPVTGGTEVASTEAEEETETLDIEFFSEEAANG